VPEVEVPVVVMLTVVGEERLRLRVTV